MKATDFENAFDSGEEIIDFLDVALATRPMQRTKRVNVDFPEWMVEKLDREARRLDVTRQSVIKFWMSEWLEVMHK